MTWVTDRDSRGWIEWGGTPSLGNTTDDERGTGVADDIHSVQVANLAPETTYFFDLVVDGERLDNGGAHYTVKTAAIIGIPSLDLAVGFVTRSDGTPVNGCLVYLSLVDGDSVGSLGRSQLLSALVGESGAWVVVIASAMETDLTRFFNYSRSGGDKLEIEAECGAQGRGELTVDSGALEPTIPLVLDAPTGP